MIYKTLEYLLRTYFHQDWMADYSSSFDAIDDFIRNENDEKVRALHDELVEILNSSTISDTLIYDYGGNYSPDIDGFSTRHWLEEVCSKTG